MSYSKIGKRRGLSGCGCGGGMGATPTPPLPTGISTTITGDPVTALILQINRFGPQAPAAYAIIPVQYALATGVVPTDVAGAAMLILQRAALDPIMAGVGSAALLPAISAGMSDPVSYVMGNLAQTTSTIQLYGDSVNLPAADSGLLSTLTSPTGLAIIAGIAALLYFSTRDH